MSSNPQAIVSNPSQIHKTLFSNMDKISPLLPPGLSIERFAQIAWNCIRRNPKLLECTPESILAGVSQGAALGLSFDPVLGQIFLVPYWNSKKKVNEAQAQVGYRGLATLAYNSGRIVKIYSEVVHNSDRLETMDGTEQKIIHVKNLDVDREKESEWKGAYAVAVTKEGVTFSKYLSAAEIYKRKAISKSADSEHSPWNTSPKEMWLKCPVRALAKLLPQSPETDLAIKAAIEDEYRDAGVETQFPEAALPQGAIEVEKAVGETKAIERRTLTLRWDAEGETAEIFPVPTELTEQVKFKDWATYLPQKKQWRTIKACVPDLVALCDELGYDVANQEAPVPAKT